VAATVRGRGTLHDGRGNALRKTLATGGLKSRSYAIGSIAMFWVIERVDVFFGP